MQYLITGSSKYIVQEYQIERLCADLGVNLVDYHIDTDNDRHPLYYIKVVSKLFLTLSRVQNVFGTNFEVQVK